MLMEMIQLRGGVTDGIKLLRRRKGKEGEKRREGREGEGRGGKGSGGKGREGETSSTPVAASTLNQSTDTSSVVTRWKMEKMGRERKVAHLPGWVPRSHIHTGLLRDGVIYRGTWP